MNHLSSHFPTLCGKISFPEVQNTGYTVWEKSNGRTKKEIQNKQEMRREGRRVIKVAHVPRMDTYSYSCASHTNGGFAFKKVARTILLLYFQLNDYFCASSNRFTPSLNPDRIGTLLGSRTRILTLYTDI